MTISLNRYFIARQVQEIENEREAITIITDKINREESYSAFFVSLSWF